jgi:hypothetical protein
MSFVLYLYGCSSITAVDLSKNQIDDYKDSEITSIVTYDNKIYEFDTKGVKPRPQIIDSLLVGWAVGAKYENEYSLREVKIPLTEIKTMSIEEVDVLNGALVIFGIVGLLCILWLIGMSTSDWNM